MANVSITHLLNAATNERCSLSYHEKDTCAWQRHPDKRFPFLATIKMPKGRFVKVECDINVRPTGQIIVEAADKIITLVGNGIWTKVVTKKFVAPTKENRLSPVYSVRTLPNGATEVETRKTWFTIDPNYVRTVDDVWVGCVSVNAKKMEEVINLLLDAWGEKTQEEWETLVKETIRDYDRDNADFLRWALTQYRFTE